MFTERWQITLLGEFQARRGEGQPIHLPRRKAKSLLAYLVSFPQRSHTRSELMDIGWVGGEKSDDPSVDLRVMLNALRKKLEPQSVEPNSILLTKGDAIRLNPSAYECDVRRFEEALNAAEKTLDPPQAIVLLDEAIQLYRGPFMAGFTDDWMTSERERLLQRYISGVRHRLKLYELSGDPKQAIQLALAAVQHAPFHQDLYTDLFRLFAQDGQPVAIRRLYDDYCARSRKELDDEPTPTMQALFQESFAAANSAEQRFEVSGQPSPQTILSNLPAPTTLFFGHEKEMEELVEMLSAVLPRLITLTGIGGIGKSRLAIETARRFLPRFDGMCRLVILTELTEAQQLPLAIRNALGLDAQAGADPLEQIIHALTQRPTLLILDNFESLLQSDSERSDNETSEGVLIVGTLLERVPELKLLVTSRQTLGLAAERKFDVKPLPLPENGAPPEILQTVPSVQLFVDRAQAIQPNFQITSIEAGVLTSLCRKLDGLPLAIKLVAGWTGMLTLTQILARMERPFDILRGGQAGVEARHRTLEAVFDASYLLLPPQMQRLFAGLSIFRGGWTLEAAEGVCGEEGLLYILEGLDYLRQRSLIVADKVGDTMRYGFLETLREYATAQLEAKDQPRLRSLHADFFVAIMGESRNQFSGSNHQTVLARLELEHDNLRTALDYTAQSGQAEKHLQLASAMAGFWAKRGYSHEGSERLARACSMDMVASPLLVGVLRWQCLLLYDQGKFDDALQCCQEALTIARGIDDAEEIAKTLYRLGNVYLAKCHYTEANAVLQEALSLFQQAGRRDGNANVLHTQGSVAFAVGDYRSAHDLYRRSLAGRQETGNVAGIAVTLQMLGSIQFEWGDIEGARSHYEQARNHFHELGHRWQEVISQVALANLLIFEGAYDEGRVELEVSIAALKSMNSQLYEGKARCYLGELCLLQNRLAEAEVQLHESLRLLLQVKNPSLIADAIDGIARLALARIRHIRAIRWFAASQKVRTVIGVPVPVNYRELRIRNIADLREILGPVTFDAAWESGAALSLEEVCQEILDGAQLASSSDI